MTVLGAIGIVAMALFLWGIYRQARSRIRQIGPPNIRARKALASYLDRWPDDLVDGVVRWQDFAALTKHDVRELLHERGWYYRGQDMDADGWPLFATRDPQLAESAEPPPSRFMLLVNELNDAAAGGEHSVLLDMTPYQVLTADEIDDAGARTGWTPGLPLSEGIAPRMTFDRDGS